MATTIRKALLAKEDIKFHDPAGGSAIQTYSRTTSIGGSANKTKLSANDLPLLDAAVVSGANTPFDEIADTLAAKTVEAALADVRKNTSELKNFDHYGGIAGAGISSANASKNTEVFNKIITDIANDGQTNGIFFPGSTYEFAEFGGAMPFTDLLSLRLVGTGATIIKRHSSASTALNLLTFQDANGLALVDLGIDRNGTAGTGVGVLVRGSVNQDIGPVKILNCTFLNGNANLVVGNTGFALSNLWISGCTFGLAAGPNLQISGMFAGHIVSNDFSGSGTGLSVLSGGGPSDYIRDSEIVGNTFRANGQNVSVVRSGIYNATAHRAISLRGNKVLAGTVTISGVNQPELIDNKVYAGSITVVLDMATANNPRFIGNEIIGATGAGLLLSGTNSTIEGFEVLGGKIENATQHGIRVLTSGAPAKWGRIQGVQILNCSREDSGATDYSGIIFDPANGAGGVLETDVSNNIIRCSTFTADNANRHLYGVEEKAGGVSDRNMIGPNYIKGYVGGGGSLRGVLTSGALSLNVVDALAAVAATYARYDGGAGA